MGVFGALTTAVTGLRAQSFALENVSGNIANSQTTAFKRIDTSFQDLIPDDVPTHQLSGNVVSMSRSTNTVQGDVQTASIGTFMAINGDGFFVVEKPASFVDNRPVFDGTNLYTRRGDFQTNKDGYLVNGAGYYLMGIPIDSNTGNLAGSVPQLLQFQQDFVPAQKTTEISYRANLAAYPLTSSHDVNVPGSELLNPVDFSANPLALPPQPAKITGQGATLLPDAIAEVVAGQVLPPTLVNVGIITVNGVDVTLSTGMSPTDVMDAVNTAAPPGVTASLNGGRLELKSADADTAITIAGSATALFAEVGLSVGTINPTNLLTQNAVAPTQTLEITIGGGTPLVITFGTGVGEISTLAELNAELTGMSVGSASVDTDNGNITITSTGVNKITVGGTVTPLTFGMHTTKAIASTQEVVASDLTTFINQSIGGGAITAYDQSGSPVNIQLRWAKIDSATLGTGHANTWNLFYQTNAVAVDEEPAWKNVGINFTFESNGKMSPVVTNVVLNDAVIDGIELGNLTMVFGSGGLTQFSDSNGSVQVNSLTQNGFAAGSLQSITVNDKGRIVGSYSNGRSIDLAQITLANFAGADFLKRIDGGAFAATDESGAATYNAAGKIVGSSLEGSNTDIADEFTKLIVTQQAYSANTRVISTSNQMVQDLLNMLR